MNEQDSCLRVEWMPIETAPKDGRPVLAYGRGTDRGMWPCDKEMPEMMCVVKWVEAWFDDYEELPDGNFKKVQKQGYAHWSPIGPHFFKPSHWQPLPPPPEPKDAATVKPEKDAVTTVLESFSPHVERPAEPPKGRWDFVAEEGKK